MIEVTIHRRASDRSIRAFAVRGHAGFDKRGRDIVCAAVSAITVGTVNAVEALTGVVLPNEVRDGFLQASVPDSLEGERAEQIRLLLESMLIMLQTIEQSYGRYIAVRERE